MNWGILGAGSVAQRRVMPAIQGLDGQSLAALMVRDQGRASALAAEYGVSNAHATAADLICDPDVDAVYVSSPVNLHHEHVLAVAGAGKHVLCEKPMGMSAAECEEMVAACDSADVTLGVCFVLRGWEIYQRIGRLLSAGELGTVVELRAHLAKWTPREADEWRLDPAQSGGGALVDVATHYLDLFRFLEGEVTRIAYMGSSRVFEWPVEETAHALVSFDSGCHGMLTASCTIPQAGNVLEIFGSEGSLFLGKTLCIVKGDDVVEEAIVFPDYYSGLLQDFAACTENGETPIASGQDGLRGLEIIEAAYLSDREDRIVSI